MTAADLAAASAAPLPSDSEESDSNEHFFSFEEQDDPTLPPAAVQPKLQQPLIEDADEALLESFPESSAQLATPGLSAVGTSTMTRTTTIVHKVQTIRQSIETSSSILQEPSDNAFGSLRKQPSLLSGTSAVAEEKMHMDDEDESVMVVEVNSSKRPSALSNVGTSSFIAPAVLIEEQGPDEVELGDKLPSKDVALLGGKRPRKDDLPQCFITEEQRNQDATKLNEISVDEVSAYLEDTVEVVAVDKTTLNKFIPDQQEQFPSLIFSDDSDEEQISHDKQVEPRLDSSVIKQKSTIVRRSEIIPAIDLGASSSEEDSNETGVATAAVPASTDVKAALASVVHHRTKPAEILNKLELSDSGEESSFDELNQQEEQDSSKVMKNSDASRLKPALSFAKQTEDLAHLTFTNISDTSIDKSMNEDSIIDNTPINLPKIQSTITIEKTFDVNNEKIERKNDDEPANLITNESIRNSTCVAINVKEQELLSTIPPSTPCRAATDGTDGTNVGDRGGFTSMVRQGCSPGRKRRLSGLDPSNILPVPPPAQFTDVVTPLTPTRRSLRRIVGALDSPCPVIASDAVNLPVFKDLHSVEEKNTIPVSTEEQNNKTSPSTTVIGKRSNVSPVIRPHVDSLSGFSESLAESVAPAPLTPLRRSSRHSVTPSRFGTPQHQVLQLIEEEQDGMVPASNKKSKQTPLKKHQETSVQPSLGTPTKSSLVSSRIFETPKKFAIETELVEQASPLSTVRRGRRKSVDLSSVSTPIKEDENSEVSTSVRRGRRNSVDLGIASTPINTPVKEDTDIGASTLTRRSRRLSITSATLLSADATLDIIQENEEEVEELFQEASEVTFTPSGISERGIGRSRRSSIAPALEAITEVAEVPVVNSKARSRKSSLAPAKSATKTAMSDSAVAVSTDM